MWILSIQLIIENESESENNERLQDFAREQQKAEEHERNRDNFLGILRTVRKFPEIRLSNMKIRGRIEIIQSILL